MNFPNLISNWNCFEYLGLFQIDKISIRGTFLPEVSLDVEYAIQLANRIPYILGHLIDALAQVLTELWEF